MKLRASQGPGRPARTARRGLVAEGRDQGGFATGWGSGQNSRICFGINWHLAPGAQDDGADDSKARARAQAQEDQ